MRPETGTEAPLAKINDRQLLLRIFIKATVFPYLIHFAGIKYGQSVLVGTSAGINDYKVKVGQHSKIYHANLKLYVERPPENIHAATAAEIDDSSDSDKLLETSTAKKASMTLS